MPSVYNYGSLNKHLISVAVWLLLLPLLLLLRLFYFFFRWIFFVRLVVSDLALNLKHLNDIFIFHFRSIEIIPFGTRIAWHKSLFHCCLHLFFSGKCLLYFFDGHSRLKFRGILQSALHKSFHEYCRTQKHLCLVVFRTWYFCVFIFFFFFHTKIFISKIKKDEKNTYKYFEWNTKMSDRAGDFSFGSIVVDIINHIDDKTILRYSTQNSTSVHHSFITFCTFFWSLLL